VTAKQTSSGVGALWRAFGVRQADDTSDGQLLQEFLARRDDRAFAVLVRRHGSMVFAVCHRVLGNIDDAEDAFQAVFLVLARRAASLLSRPVLGDWLHGVARRTALNARRSAARRRAKEQRMARPESQSPEPRNDWLPLLDEELCRLPKKYRQPIVLCDLEGRTRTEAARQLGIPEGTVATRRARALSLLVKRLTRRGVVTSSATLSALLVGKASPGTASLVVAATLLAETCGLPARSESGIISLSESGIISLNVSRLTEGVLKAMLFSRIKKVVSAILVTSLIAFGAGLLGYRSAFGQAPGQDPRGARLSLTPETVSRLGIRTVEALPRGGNPKVVREIGTLNYDNERLFSVRTRFPGEVTVLADVKDGQVTRPPRYGDKVKEGQLLAVLTSRELGERKAAFVDALWKLHLSQEKLAWMHNLWKEGSLPNATLERGKQQVQNDSNEVLTAERTLRMWKLSDEELMELRREVEQIRKDSGKRDSKKEALWARVEIRSPADGTIVEKNVNVHDMVDPTNSPPLFKVGDSRLLQIHVRFPNEHLPWIRDTLKSGKKLTWEIRFPSEPNAPPLELNIRQLIPQGPDIIPVLIGNLDNKEGKYLVGEFVTATIPLPRREPKTPRPTLEVSVPASALVEQAGATFVLIQTDPKQLDFEARRVVVIRRGSDTVHLSARLTAEQERQGFQVVRPGEQVATAGAIALKAMLDDRTAKHER
jgi:RNA polymerase sigma factor (sigma-70 family)